MIKIYLSRHGQDQDNLNGILNGHRNMSLTDKGIEQAIEVAKKIKAVGIKFDKVYASPLERAHRTAELISKITKSPKPITLNLLIERDFGVLTGQPYSKIPEVCRGNVLKTKTVTYFLSPEGAETFPELLKRGKKIIDQINERHKDGNILLVTHGDIGKMIYAAYYNLEWETVLKQFHFGNSELLLLSSNSSPEDSHVFKIKQYNL